VSDDRVYQFTAISNLNLTAKFLAMEYLGYDSSNTITFGDFSYYVSNNEATLRKYTGTASEVAIPAKIGNINALNAAYAGLSENTSSTTYTLTLNPNGGTVTPTTQTGTRLRFNLPN